MARLVPTLALFALVACSSSSAGEIGVATGLDIAAVPEADRVAAPPIAGDRLGEGEAIAPALYEGKVAVVNFWGSWCGPCLKEQPLLEAAWLRYRGRGVQFVGVNTRRDQEAAALAFLDRFDVSYPSVFDPTSRIAFEQGVLFMPSTVVIDREGRVAATIVGALRSADELDALLEAELA